MHQLDLAIEFEANTEHGWVAPLFSWDEVNDFRGMNEDEVRWVIHPMLLNKMRKDEDRTHDLIGGTTFCPTNSEIDHASNILPGLDVFSKVRCCNAACHCMKQKKHLVPSMKNVRIEENIVLTAKKQLATMCDMMNHLINHEHPQKTHKHRIECSHENKGRSTCSMMSRSNSIKLLDTFKSLEEFSSNALNVPNNLMLLLLFIMLHMLRPLFS